MGGFETECRIGREALWRQIKAVLFDIIKTTILSIHSSVNYTEYVKENSLIRLDLKLPLLFYRNIKGLKL